jgi:hypothetical protein
LDYPAAAQERDEASEHGNTQGIEDAHVLRFTRCARSPSTAMATLLPHDPHDGLRRQAVVRGNR